MDQVNLIPFTRLALLVTSGLGLIFTTIPHICDSFYPLTLFYFFLVSFMTNVSIYIYQQRSKAIRLPLLPATGSIVQPRNSAVLLIAASDLVLGTLLMVVHVMGISATRKKWKVGMEHHAGLGVLMIYGLFAILASAVMHQTLGLLQVVKWRKDRAGQESSACSRCGQRGRETDL